MGDDVMCCEACGSQIGGEWFDGTQFECEDCGAELIATAFTDGTWVARVVDDESEVANG